MGLDMYLQAERYLSGWEHSKSEERALFKKVLKASGLPASVVTNGAPSGTISFNVAYWRKANAIHSWFVKNIQGGKDECRESYVGREKLQKLLDDTKAALAAGDKAKDILPTQPGFFFGSTEYNEWYVQDLSSTIRQLEKALALPNAWEFSYRASW